MSKPLILEIIKKIKLEMRPIGSIEINVTGENPANYIGGTWVAWGAGRVPVGVDGTQTEFKTAEIEGGEKNHELSVAEMPAHNHSVKVGISEEGQSQTMIDFIYNARLAWNIDGTHYAGGNQPHNNLQPYITCYMWKRTA